MLATPTNMPVVASIAPTNAPAVPQTNQLAVKIIPAAAVSSPTPRAGKSKH